MNGDGDDGWVGNEDGERAGNGESEGGDAVDDGGLNDVSDILADAILKRPESIRARSTNHSNVPEQAEFTFPSISNLGNVSGSVKEEVVVVSVGGGDDDNEDR